MEVELKDMWNDLESLKQSLTDPSLRGPVDKVHLIFCYCVISFYPSIRN